MRFVFTLLMACMVFNLHAQVSIGPRHKGPAAKFKKGELSQFKKTTTVFVLSNQIDQTSYEQLLKEVWTVTPFIVVPYEDFVMADYLKDGYSFAQLTGEQVTQRNSFGQEGVIALAGFVDVVMYDHEPMLKLIEKLSTKKRQNEEAVTMLINKHTTNIARFYLHPRDTYIQTAIAFNASLGSMTESMYTEEVFYNYYPGYLKNYFQKINAHLLSEERYWIFGNDQSPELKALQNHTLYVPDYLSVSYSKWKAKDKDGGSGAIENLFEEYAYSYEVIKDEELSQRILAGDDIYYMRYVRVNTERFVQIVHAPTGEILYRDYIPGIGANLKPKRIGDLSDAIRKASK